MESPAADGPTPGRRAQVTGGAGPPGWAVVAALWIWFAVSLVTHHGAASPYSYVCGVLGTSAASISGFIVNPDALTVVHATRFFYEGADVPFSSAHNLKLPLHSFLAAVAMSFLRSYMAANLLVNLLSLWLLAWVAVTLADRFHLPRSATLLAGLTCAALPLHTHYIGQPMHYIVGVCTNFLVMLAAVEMERDGVRDPFRLGILTAVLALGYDPFVFLAAILWWIVRRVRWTSVRDQVVYLAVSAAPILVWRLFIHLASGGRQSTALQQSFFEPVREAWHGMLWHPVQHGLEPLAAAHVGLAFSGLMLLAQVYWPVLAVCAVGLLTARGRLSGSPGGALLVALAVFFLLEQCASAAWDWENHPRRAASLLLVVSFAYFAVVARHAGQRGWTAAFSLVFALSTFLTFADTLTGSPLVGYVQTGEAMKAPQKDLVRIAASRLDRKTYPRLMSDGERKWRDTGAADVRRPLLFLLTNLLPGILAVAFLSVLKSCRLVPRWTPAVAAGAFALSLLVRLL